VTRLYLRLDLIAHLLAVVTKESRHLEEKKTPPTHASQVVKGRKPNTGAGTPV